jgi:hypothetical protein
LDWLGELAGDCKVDELDELLEELDERELELELEPEFELDEFEVPDELLLVDDPESLVVVAWVAPGRTATSAPATATLANDAVTVVAVSRLRPCSRSATARASCRAFSRLSMSTSLPRPAEEAVRARSKNPLRPHGRALPGQRRLESWGNAQRRLLHRLPRGP